MKDRNTKMKRLLVISQYFYPEEFRINDICCEWIKRGYEVTVLTGIPNYPQGKFYKGYGILSKRRETWNGVKIIRIPLISRGKSNFRLVMNYLSFILSGFLWNIFTKIKVDKVFIFEVSPMTQALNGVWYAKRRMIPCYLYVQDLWPESIESVTGIHSKYVIKPIEKMVRYIYNNCSIIFTTSNSFVKEVRKYTTKDYSRVIYWPQYAEEFYKPMELKKMRTQETVFSIIFAGNIGSAQGLEILPSVAKLLSEMKYNIKFILVGEGRCRKQLERKVEQDKVTNYFEFRNRVLPHDIPRVLAEGNVAFISFNDNELFSKIIPAKLQTYMACGMPILAVASGETEKIINESNCGINCKIGDITEIVDAIIKLKNLSKEDLSILGNNGRKYFEKNFNKKILMDKMDNYLNE